MVHVTFFTVWFQKCCRLWRVIIKLLFAYKAKDINIYFTGLLTMSHEQSAIWFLRNSWSVIKQKQTQFQAETRIKYCYPMNVKFFFKKHAFQCRVICRICETEVSGRICWHCSAVWELKFLKVVLLRAVRSLAGLWCWQQKVENISDLIL